MLNEHGDAIEADLLRFYRIDVLDFYRGTLSARRLGVLIRQLPAESALVRALNGGRIPWGNVENLVADLWALILKVNSSANARVQDHPVRAELEAKSRAEAKRAKVIDMRSKFEKRKQAYGLG
ncbi:hypothetical protein [Mycolicibacterium iranicum]|uniref:Tail assembly chaperone n=1 Tax=Mycolicibacterium iranicum TaxID=912594 RepID=A0A178LBF7_MYCIR|nr:hypothetical protein [Mycolicibacterium iranicum]OAN26233.1 hypothetical protein A4X20_30525 [Mycolicibacterium iranicum]